MSSEQFVAAAIQMVSTHDVDANQARATALIARAAEQQSLTLVVLPENVLGMGPDLHQTLAERLPYHLEWLQELAAKYQINIVAGSLPVATRPDGSSISGRFRSASYVIGVAGEILGRYDKLHLFDVDVGDAQGSYRESDTFEAGESTQIIELAGHKVGLSICYDLRFPELFQRLVLGGAELIVLPAAFTKVTGRAHWEVLLRARAIETQCFVVAANQGGKHSEQRETWGQSMIVDPWGQILTQCGEGEHICVAPLDFERLKEIRGSMPIQQHKRPFDELRERLGELK